MFVIGIDYGTDSVRSVLVNAANGQEVVSSVFYYPRWKQGLYCNPSESRFRQHPLDYVEGLEATIKECIAKAGANIASQIKAISVDTTGSTPVAVDENGTPLALKPGFEENPNAMFILWKDHTSIKEAEEINAHAEKFDINYLKYVGGIYSSEWYWAKLLHVLREDANIQKEIYSFVEHCDWIPFLLTGGNSADNIKRSVCAAGHKALYAPEFDGLPPQKFFSQLDPLLDEFVSRLFATAYTSAEAAGTISPEWAQRLGIPADVKIGVGAFDCHMGAVGGQIEPYYLSKVMGTSTCDMLVAPIDEVKNILVRGICGQVNGSIIPGMIGMEAGQSAFGDAYAWFKNLLLWPLKNLKTEQINEEALSEIENQIISELSKQAAKINPEHEAEYAVEWFNGRRTPDANQALTGAFFGLSLGTDAVNIFRAIVESTCFGARTIVERFVQEGIQVKGLIGLGGVAKKSPFIMQMMADVINMPIKIHKSEQTCAIGAAMFAATVAGLYPNVETAMEAMGQGFDAEYFPNPERVAIYDNRYQHYLKIGAFVESNLK